jgi:PAS domain S-box-containing protein
VESSSDVTRSFFALIERIPEGVILIDPSGIIRAWNKEMETLSETPTGRVIGEKLWDVQFSFIPTEERSSETYRELMDTFRRTIGDPESPDFRRTFERYYTLPSGSTKYVQTLLFPLELPGGTHLCGVLRDITERRRAEAGIYRREIRFQTLIDTMAHGFLCIDEEGNIETANQAAVDILGIPREELTRRSIYDKDWKVVRADGSEYTEEELPVRKHISSGESQRGIISGVYNPRERRYRWLLTNTTRVSGEYNEACGYYVTFSDITDLKETADSLRESRKRYREFFDDDLTGDLISDVDGKILDCNAAFAGMFGFSSVEEAKEHSMAELHWPPETRKNFLDLLVRERRLENLEYEFRTLRGKPLYAVMNVIGIFDDDDELTAIRGYIFDITSRRRLQEQLFQSQKLEAIGKLTGGIAHDFNNMLTVIQGFTRFMLKDEEPDTKRFTYLQEIDKASSRAASFINQLLAFSRRQVMDLEPVELNTLLSDSLAMIKRLIGEHIELHLIPTKGSTRVMADQGQIIQILMNLTANSRDALPTGGLLVLRTRRIRLSGPIDMGGFSLRENRYVEILIADNGEGMDAKTKKMVLEPFFSTKGLGKGTGLGLSTTYGIIKQLDGYLLYESEPTRGTVMSILLPAVSGPIPHREEGKKDRTVQSFRGTERVLLVEDDPDVRRVLAVELRSVGYTVVEAADGEEALVRVREKRTDIVITDVVMPKLDGVQLAKHLQEEYPETEIILMSGYPDGLTAEEEELIGRFIAKPIIPQLLLKTVRELLDRRNTEAE